MNAETNPGMGLTILQLIPALGEKLKNQELLATLTPGEVDTLEKIVSPIPSKFRRWQNSQLSVNRLPHEILVLIATYLETPRMLIRLTLVCTHWRRIIIGCPVLWTCIRIGRGGVPFAMGKLFFERADGCALDVYVSRSLLRSRSPMKDSQITELPPGKRIKTLSIADCSWDSVLHVIYKWADALSGLQELELNADDDPPTSQSVTAFPLNTLKSLKLKKHGIPGLYCIKAPNLTVLQLREGYQTPCSATVLLDFLETAPNLEEVSIQLHSSVLNSFPLPNRILTLSHVQCIAIDTNHALWLASHLLCPSSTDTKFMITFPDDPATGIFPLSLESLLGQYAVEMIDRVLMGVLDEEGRESCSLQLCTPSGTVLQIACETPMPEEFPPPPLPDPQWTFPVIFDQVVSALLSLPLHAVTTFAIDADHRSSDPTIGPTDIVPGLAKVFKKCRNLHKVVLENYLPSCLPIFSRDEMPPIRVLVIKHPKDVTWSSFIAHAAEVARIRDSKGAPLERVEIFTHEKHPDIEPVQRWVHDVRYQAVTGR